MAGFDKLNFKIFLHFPQRWSHYLFGFKTWYPFLDVDYIKLPRLTHYNIPGETKKSKFNVRACITRDPLSDAHAQH
jgi:hypothetical protein